MKPKRQKYYTSEAMIIKDIDKAIKRREKLIAKSEYEDATADLYAGSEDPEVRTKIEEHRDCARECRSKAQRLQDTRLVKLKNTLSAWQTRPMEIEGFVDQVVLQPK